MRFIADKNLSESLDAATIAKIRALAFKIPPLTFTIRDGIISLRDEYKLLSRIAAVSRKSNQVANNLFIFKKRDAIKQTLLTYEEIRNLVTIFDIKDLPYIGDTSRMG